ncbi:MAG: diphosphomevalonate decarboxylase [Pseudomonadota bacterium]
MPDFVRDLIHSAMAEVTEANAFTAYAPSNIALSKYWGKRDSALNLPMNSSISISLGQWGSRTTVAPSPTAADIVCHNGQQLPGDADFMRRTLAFVEIFRNGRDLPLAITTENTVPTGAGLASSASGFAALTRALCGAFALELDETAMSLIARHGSGSAARSLWHGFVRWNVGEQADGSDSHGVSLDLRWPAFHIAILAVDTGPKTKSSRSGMNHTVETSPLFAAWPAMSEVDCDFIETAIAEKRFDLLGPRVEANALAMHATMLAARPSLKYLSSQSWQSLERLWEARAQGLNAFATMDAGPNIKLVFLEDETSDVLQIFPTAEVIDPFGFA